eukprot:TRINITY_DN54590_c0_g1_i1.p1 TRINITY_DN54590_c0_g1~~TRINITY_DN54590_c0_g1_i1.p1  ORF type:complete len:394 (-),score=50.23 TRINITY_DN54590_c0_g1_i1:129-1310(-)
MSVGLFTLLCFAEYTSSQAHEPVGGKELSNEKIAFKLAAPVTDEAAEVSLPGLFDNPNKVVRRQTSAWKMLWEAVKHQLNMGFQWLNALIVTVFALAMLIDGQFVFKYIVVAFIACFAYLLTLSALEDYLNDGSTQDAVLLHFVASEVALVIAFVSYKGYAGILFLLGMLFGTLLFIGLFIALHASAMLRGSTKDIVAQLVLGNLCVLLGIMVVTTDHIYQRCVATVSSLIGGFLLAASVGFFFEWFCVISTGIRDSLSSSGFDVPSACPPWVAFADSLLTGTPEVGILHSKIKVHLGATELCFDRWITFLLWFMFAGIGLCIQVKIDQKRAREMFKGKDARKNQQRRGEASRVETTSRGADRSRDHRGELRAVQDFWRSKGRRAEVGERLLR